jgi:hypothetical protein
LEFGRSPLPRKRAPPQCTIPPLRDSASAHPYRPPTTPPRHPRLEEHARPVKLEVLPLPRRKRADVHALAERRAHALERSAVRHRRDEQPAVALERDEAAVEQVIDRRREEQAVLAIEALGVFRRTLRRRPPGAARTRTPDDT